MSKRKRKLPTKEQVEAFTGIPLPEKEGHKVEIIGWGDGQGYAAMDAADTYWFNSTMKEWVECKNGCLYRYTFYVRLIPTRREDGTPLSIPPLPEFDGYRGEYFGVELDDLGDSDGYAYYHEAFCNGWVKSNSVILAGFGEATHYALLYKIKTPTKITDIVGEDGTKRAWAYKPEGEIFELPITKPTEGEYRLKGRKLEQLEELDWRWANTPFSTYKDANEFVV